jgi:hypothetical protein
MPTQLYLISASVVAAFGLGAYGATFVLSRWWRVRRSIGWDAGEQWRILPEELSQIIQAPVSLQIGEKPISSLNQIYLRITATGNLALEDVDGIIAVNPGGTILGIRHNAASSDIDKISFLLGGESCRISIKLLLPGYSALMQILAENYEDGSLEIHLRDRQIEVKRQWSIRQHTPLLRSIGLGIPGVRYDPAARAMTLIADELKTIRKIIDRSRV